MSNGSSILSIDDGGYEVKIKSDKILTSFPSVKGLLTTEPNLMTVTGEHDFIVEMNDGSKYVAGELAVHDCPLRMEMNSFGKNHLFWDLSVLIAVYKYGGVNNKIAVSLPIKSYTKEEVENRKKRLEGSKTLTVNGKTKTFFIEEVKVSPETAISFFVNKDEGKTHYIDIGSRTVNSASVVYENGKYRFIDSESDTFYNYGITALAEKFNPRSLADYIGGRLIKTFDNKNKIYVLGGGALNYDLVHYLKEYFPKLIVMENPTTSNVRGMYELMKGAYGSD